MGLLEISRVTLTGKNICNEDLHLLFYFQRYRHVDYVQFENPFIVEQFLNYWRSTGNQRIGMMYGRYEHHEKVPLGIRASVAAIYEPPQVFIWYDVIY